MPSPPHLLGPQLLAEGKPCVAPQLSGSIRGQCGLPCTVLHVELEAGSTFCVLWSEPVAFSIAHNLTVPCEVCLSCWTRPSLLAASEEMSPRATSMSGLRVEHGAWGFALPSRDPRPVDRCGPAGLGCVCVAGRGSCDGASVSQAELLASCSCSCHSGRPVTFPEVTQ